MPDLMNSLDDRILIESCTTFSSSAYFAKREDAELWAREKVSQSECAVFDDRNVRWSVLEVNPDSDLEVEVAKMVGVTTLWRAWVSNMS